MKQGNFKNVQSDAVRGGRDTSRVAMAEDGIAVLQIALLQLALTAQSLM